MRKLIFVLAVLVPLSLLAVNSQKDPKKPKEPKTKTEKVKKEKTEKPKKEKKEKAPKQEKIDKKCLSDDFSGTDRKMAKTTIASKSTETFADLESVLKSLPEDKIMLTRNPPISTLPYFLRVAEENRNVKITDVYIFAVVRQSDNDFLVLLGSDPDFKKARFFDTEVSGLPESSKEAYTILKAVREKVKSRFGNVCGKPVLMMENPVKASVSGSLLFDPDNKNGKNDPKKMKSKTSWEIHPVTEIEFM